VDYAAKLSKTPINDKRRQEVLGGKIVSMARPNIDHIRAGRNLIKIFALYLDNKKCELLYDPDVRFCDKDKTIPDIAIVCNPNIIKGDRVYGVQEY